MADALNRADVGPPDRELTAIQKREVSHRRSGGADTPILSVGQPPIVLLAFSIAPIESGRVRKMRREGRLTRPRRGLQRGLHERWLSSPSIV
jgi:hypothetical protein